VKGWSQSPISLLDHEVEDHRLAGAGKAALDKLLGQSGETRRVRCVHRSEDRAASATW
jgi:hypothetical protein